MNSERQRPLAGTTPTEVVGRFQTAQAAFLGTCARVGTADEFGRAVLYA